MKSIHIYSNGRLEEKQSGIVREFPLVLHVNGREIATLIASPHDLRFLVAGFLRNQGFVEQSGDFHMLAVCDEFGIANVRVRQDLPERLKPVLTSGCGTGIGTQVPNITSAVARSGARAAASSATSEPRLWPASAACRTPAASSDW